jgi:hypothetical protein
MGQGARFGARVMVRAAASLAMVSALRLGASAVAHAETAPQNPTQSQNPNAFNAAMPRKSLQWDGNGKWTLNLDMDQPVGRNMEMKDVSAGAFFHITPSMRIGGSVGLADRFADPDKIVPQDTTEAPRVHLETKFKF